MNFTAHSVNRWSARAERGRKEQVIDLSDGPAAIITGGQKPSADFSGAYPPLPTYSAE